MDYCAQYKKDHPDIQVTCYTNAWQDTQFYTNVHIQEPQPSPWDRFTANSTPIAAMFIALCISTVIISIVRIFHKTERLKNKMEHIDGMDCNAKREAWLKVKYSQEKADPARTDDDDESLGI